MKWKDEYKKTLQSIYKLFIEWENQQIIGKKMKKEIKQQKKKKKKKTASSPDQDLHPDWDRFRGTVLYPLSCGELAMKGELNVKMICNKWSRYCKEQVNKGSEEKGFWL